MSGASVTRLQEEISGLARNLYACTTPLAMGHALSCGIGRMIGHDSMVLCDGSMTTGRSVYHLQTIGSEMDAYLPMFEKYLQQVPFVRHYICNPGSAPVRTYDIVRAHDLHRTEVYGEAFARLGMEEQLGVEIPTVAGTLRGWMLNRSRPGFSERDLEIVELLRPHLAAATATADQWQRLDQPGSSRFRRGSVILNERGRVFFSSPEAQRLLVDFGRTFGRELPTAVEDWLKRELIRFRAPDLWASPRQALLLEGDEAQLVLRLASSEEGHVLLLEERQSRARSRAVEGLSPREREVLEWISCGKTNDEIARILEVSVHTVKNHVKRVLTVLGVENRTAAAAMSLRGNQD